jgi:chorismate synthase
MEILGGPLFGVAGAGESHGPAVTTIVFGCPAGLKLSRQQVQHYLDRRRPGSNRHGTPRHEADRVVLTAGLFDPDQLDTLTSGPEITVADGDKSWTAPSYETGYTTGEPLAALVLSSSSKSEHYAQFAGPQGAVRPGHTDLVKHYKSQGWVDYRGGGRSSYRATISDVIGGSVARLYLKETFGTVILSSIIQVGPLTTTLRLQDRFTMGTASDAEVAQVTSELEAAEIYSLDHAFAKEAGELIKATRKQGDSLGARVEVVALNVPPLVGEPLYNSLKLRLMGSLGGLHAVTACEIGAGFAAAGRLGSNNNDPIRRRGYVSNHHGGMIGGVTTGAPITATVAFKPTSTINKPQQSVRKDLSEIDYELHKGRHDPCVGVRAGVTLESRLAIELMNAVLMHQAARVDPANFRLFE